MTFEAHFLTTHLGSLPHTEYGSLCADLISWLDIPAWPQLSRRDFRENMYVQFSANVPGIVMDEVGEKITFDTVSDLLPAMEAFYERYLAEDVDSFALDPQYAAGFYQMVDGLKATSGDWAKGQVTGPISFGLTVTDQDLRASLYDDMLADVIVKNVALVARWQVRQLRAIRPNVIIFLDEPYMASFGSAYISLSREQVITMFDEIFTAIHEEGALVGIHCCGNTDWSVLLETSVDILNLDAYSHLDTLALYPAELQRFLARGGGIAWGIVPNNEAIMDTTPEALANRLHDGLDTLCQKAQARDVKLQFQDFSRCSFITPSCGLGSTNVAIAERVLKTLADTAAFLRKIN
jgi:methionine synthase II (cobalamin-independent)